MRRLALNALALAPLVLASRPAWAQHTGHEGHAPPAEATTPRGDEGQRHAGHGDERATDGPDVAPAHASHARDGSGTAWLPDATPMHALHGSAGAWSFMVHGNVFVYAIAEGSERGGAEAGSVNWIMGMARRPVAGGDLELRVMLSAEPATVPGCGYPNLLASGEVCDGEAIVDEQHPHDLFMELAARYGRPLAGGVSAQVYAAFAGEPALGPVAYPHRISALPNPLAPITHHWLDATHIAFGVITAGLFGEAWKLEGSAFNGREPDDERWDLDLAPLDSFAARIWWMPSARWAVQVSAGRLEDAEQDVETGARRDVVRATASATFHRPLVEGLWATTAAWGRNAEAKEHATNAVLVESALDVGRDVLFARAEVVQKSTHDLALPGDGEHWVGKVGVGYLRELGPYGGLLPGLGAQLLYSALPDALEAPYGTQLPVGIVIFARITPAAAANAPPAHGPHRVPGTSPRYGSTRRR